MYICIYVYMYICIYVYIYIYIYIFFFFFLYIFFLYIFFFIYIGIYIVLCVATMYVSPSSDVSRDELAPVARRNRWRNVHTQEEAPNYDVCSRVWCGRLAK